jgi:hypothetical protein
LKTKYQQLESEVTDLEFVINFCEENLKTKKVSDLDDEEIAEVENLKRVADSFIHLQYYAIVDRYKEYVEKMKIVIEEYYKENNENINMEDDFQTIMRIAMDKLQEVIRGISVTLKNNNSTVTRKDKNINNKNFDLDKEYTEKIDKLKVILF